MAALGTRLDAMYSPSPACGTVPGLYFRRSCYMKPRFLSFGFSRFMFPPQRENVHPKRKVSPRSGNTLRCIFRWGTVPFTTASTSQHYGRSTCLGHLRQWTWMQDRHRSRLDGTLSAVIRSSSLIMPSDAKCQSIFNLLAILSHPVRSTWQFV